MIFLDAAFYFLCEIEAMHDTVFFNEHGYCIAMCDAGSKSVHSCFDSHGNPLTDCVDRRGRQVTLCSGNVYIVNEDEYYISGEKK